MCWRSLQHSEDRIAKKHGQFSSKLERSSVSMGSVDEVDATVTEGPRHRCTNTMCDVCFSSSVT